MKKFKIDDYLLTTNIKTRRLIKLITAFLVFLSTAIVYLTGGIPSAFSHTMYIPIILAAFCCGPWCALVTALIGGFLVGPFMSFSFMLGSGEALINSIYRTFFFMGVGVLIGFIFQHARKRLNKITNDFYHDKKTGIPNINYYFKAAEDQEYKKMVIFNIQLHNSEDINTLLGSEEYTKFTIYSYEKIKAFFSEKTKIISPSERRMVVELNKDQYQNSLENFIRYLDEINFENAGIPFFMDYTVGISLDDDKKDLQTRLREGVVSALYAKNKNLKYAIYNINYEKEQKFIETLGRLPFAIKEKQLFLEYQPVIDLKNKNCVTIEALIRWQDKEGIISPNDFIPYAERTRLINLITEWVFEQVINDFKILESSNIAVNIAVNISQRDLHEKIFVENLINKIKQAKVISSRIEIEVTESSLMLNKEVASECLNLLKENNFTIILDDFGNKYSSLAYLRDLPVQKIKVDRNYISDLSPTSQQRKLVDVIIKLAHNLGFSVIAEGIEDIDTFNILNDLKADYVQGYLFARPMKLQNFIRWYQEYEEAKKA